MSDSNVITRLPLRIYTPIKDLQYNALEATDIEEMPNFLNVNVGEMKALAPVVCQEHEPHESLRLVPWVKPTVPPSDDDEAIPRGVWHWVNGRWLGLVPEYETLQAIELEAENAKADIEIHKIKVDEYKAGILDVDGKYYECLELMRSMRKSFIRTLQKASHNAWMFGHEKNVKIHSGTGVFDPEKHPNGHAFIDFVGVESMPVNQIHREFHQRHYRTYCYPMTYAAAALGLGDVWGSVSTHKSYPPITARPTLAQWNVLREWYEMIRKRKTGFRKPLPELPFPEYTKERFAYDFGYDPEALPFMQIEFTEDNKPNNFIHATVQYRIERFELSPGDEKDIVTGANIWFTNYDHTGETPGVKCPALNGDRIISFNWATFGKRKTPPEIWTE